MSGPAGSGHWASAYAELSRGRLHYMAAGAGMPIVLLHGWPGFWFDYRYLVPAAAALGRAIASDFFGFGDSDRLDGDPVAIADESAFARDIVELLDAVGADRAVLVGHDIGSAVAPAVARLAPERVVGLVLLNPTHPYIGDKRYTPAAQREAWYQHFHLLPLAERLIDGDRPRVADYLEHFYSHWAGDERITVADLAVIVDVYARAGAFAASIAWYRARAARRPGGEVAPAVDLPTIALWGDSDPMRPLEAREGFERAFPRARSRVLPGVGHFVAAEAPDDVADAIAALLADSDG